MKDYLFLKILDKFKGLFPNSIDYNSLRNIINLKILLDSRTSSNMGLQSLRGNRKSLITSMFNKKNSDGTPKDSNRNLTTMLLYLFIGGISSTLIGLPVSIEESLGVIITFFMIFIGTKIISVFSTVLIDTNDSKILMAKPVNKKTLGAARTIYAIYYITMMSLSFIIIPVIVVGLTISPIYSLVLLIETVLVNMFLVGIVALLYYFVLKFFDGEKLKDVVNGIQIVLGLIIFFVSHAVYIVEPIAIRIDKMKFHTWYMFTPTFWFTSPYTLLKGNISFIPIVGTLSGILIPIIFISIYLSRLDKFEDYLQKLDSVSKGKKHGKFNLFHSIGKLFCRDKQELAFYDFSIEIMKNEREFRTKVYPQIASSLFSPLVIILAFTQTISYKQIRTEPWYLAFYLGTMSIAGLVYMIRYSNGYKGAWIYHVVPLKDESLPFTGALKAFFVRIIMPTLLLISIIMVVVWGLQVIPQAITIIFATAFSIAISYKYSTAVLPFSTSFRDRPRGNKGKGFIIMFIMLAIAILQFLFDRFIPYGNYILMVIAVAACIGTWKYIFSAPKKLVTY